MHLPLPTYIHVTMAKSCDSYFQFKYTIINVVITNSDFISSVRQECGHLLREEDIRWLKDRVEDNSTGVVDYSNVVNVMKDNFVSSFYIF